MVSLGISELEPQLMPGPHDQTCEEHQLYIFTRACFLLRRMGYEEKAIASFQALLEL